MNLYQITSKSILFIFLSWLPITTIAQDSMIPIPERPASFVVVYDKGNILSDKEEEVLSVQMRQHSDTIDMLMISVKSLDNHTIEQYSRAWFDSWKIGKKAKYGGLLFFIAHGDKKIHIEISPKLNKYITDYDAQSLVEKKLSPNFKKGYFYKGFFEAITAVWDLWHRAKK
jgi:uncharacterized protein